MCVCVRVRACDDDCDDVVFLFYLCFIYVERLILFREDDEDDVLLTQHAYLSLDLSMSRSITFLIINRPSNDENE